MQKKPTYNTIDGRFIKEQKELVIKHKKRKETIKKYLPIIFPSVVFVLFTCATIVLVLYIPNTPSNNISNVNNINDNPAEETSVFINPQDGSLTKPVQIKATDKTTSNIRNTGSGIINQDKIILIENRTPIYIPKISNTGPPIDE